MAGAKEFILTSSGITEREQPFSHPWNPKSQLIGVQLSRAVGLKRELGFISSNSMTRAAGLLAEHIKQSWQFAGVSIARIPPGKESFVTTRTNPKKSGSTSFPGAALPKSLAKR
jgi:hypothetical protein